jgi:hypothetical protein
MGPPGSGRDKAKEVGYRAGARHPGLCCRFCGPDSETTGLATPFYIFTASKLVYFCQICSWAKLIDQMKLF